MHTDKVPVQGQFQEPPQAVPTLSCCCQGNASQGGMHWPCLLGGLLFRASQTSQVRKGSRDTGAGSCHFLLPVPPGGQDGGHQPLSPLCSTDGHSGRGPGNPHMAVGALSTDATTNTWSALRSSSPGDTGHTGKGAVFLGLCWHWGPHPRVTAQGSGQPAPHGLQHPGLCPSSEVTTLQWINFRIRSR